MLFKNMMIGELLNLVFFYSRHVHLVEYFNNLRKTEDKLRDHITNMEICQD